MATFSKDDARKFYDGFGAKQDEQAYYEDAATQLLVQHAAFDQAEVVVEFGCGTGRFADHLLADVLSPDARYSGYDLSATMIDLAAERLAEHGDRAGVTLTDGAVRFDEIDGTVDCVVSNYVLDLLDDEDIHDVLAEAARVLKWDGKLCLVSLTYGNTLLSKMVSALWGAVRNIRPVTVGGCRPIRLTNYIHEPDWDIEFDETVVASGIPSEVLIATPRARRDEAGV